MHWSVKGIHDYQTVPLDSNVKSIIEGEKIARAKALKLMKNVELIKVGISFDSIDDLKNSLAEINYGYCAKNEDFFGNSDLLCFITIDISKQAITSFDAYGDNKLYGVPLDISKWKIDIKDLYKIISQKAPDYIKNKNPNNTISIGTGVDIWEVFDVPPHEPGTYNQKKIINIDPTVEIE